jgi:hypothetical protein
MCVNIAHKRNLDSICANICKLINRVTYNLSPMLKSATFLLITYKGDFFWVR